MNKESKKLKKPALVGSGVFREGVDESLVIEAAQRQYEYKSNWISLEERVPEEGILCIVFWYEDYNWQMEIDYIEEGMWEAWFNRAEHFNIAGGNCKEEAPYTHWMQIPIPPVKKEIDHATN